MLVHSPKEALDVYEVSPRVNFALNREQEAIA